MKTIWILLITLLFIVPANAVVITCVSEGSGVVRIDYSASDETILPIAFALNVTVDGGAVIKNVYGYKVGDSNAASPGYGIFPASMKIDETGEIFDWGSPVDNNGIGTSTVTLGMASRYNDVSNAPKVSGTLCRILVDTHGAPLVNVRVVANAAQGGVVLQNAAAGKFNAIGCTVSGTGTGTGTNTGTGTGTGTNTNTGTGTGTGTTTIPLAPASISYPTSNYIGQYTVSWASSTGATFYRLQRSNDAGSTWAQIYLGANLTYSENVSNGSYRYRVRASNTAGTSSWRTGTTNCVVLLLPPRAPASISYPTSNNTGHYTISWPASTRATSYRLQRSNDGGSTWTQIYLGANLTYSENVANGSYRYRVRASNTVGTSSWRTGTSDCRVYIEGSHDDREGYDD